MNWQSMMTKSRKRLAACLVLVLVGMSACSSDPGSGNNGQDDNNGEADTEVMADADDDATDGGSDATDTGDETDTDPDAEPDTDEEQARSSLSLRVLDIDGTAIEAASITVGQATAQTDADGRITFDDLDAGRTLAAVAADGYAPATEVVQLPESTDAARTIHLLATGEPHPFDPTTISELYEDRVHVTIPANALVDTDGNAYTGDAQALITPLNPSTDELSAAPGPLEGVLEGDTEPTPMQSVFMADIQLQTDTGEPLELADGQNATLEFVIPDDLQGDFSTGDDIEAYWYDTSAGMWIQEGMGTVIESTYAAEKLAWTVDVAHFTWWNCDEPWYDKECVRVEVLDEGTGEPVSGAQVLVDGETYNGTTFGLTGDNGITCVDFKLGSTAHVTASGPDGREQVGDAIEITGNGTAATCAGQGAGTCQEIQINLAPPACLSGSIEDEDGNPIEGVNVTGIYPGAFGNESIGATTDASGEYCLSVPRDSEVDIIASFFDGNTYKTASDTVTAADESQMCGGDSCTTVDALTPLAGQSGCINGRAVKGPPGSDNDGPVAPGTHVYVFEGKIGDAAAPGSFAIDCSKPPEEWGTLLAESTTGTDGNFCLGAPITASEMSVVVGKCGSAQERCLQVRQGVTVTEPASCGDDGCTDLIEPIYMSGRACGEGP
jgi:hypothetical protein